MVALEDALLSAYKKQPGAARYARRHGPRDSDFLVFRYIIPPQLQAHPIVETIDEGTTYDPETGEMVEPQDPEIDPAKFEQYRDQIEEVDDTPDDFRRIAAQTAKQVMLQRIREAERDIMFEVPRPRRRADHRHRPAVGLALHARPAARARRGAAAGSPSRSTASATTTPSASRP